MLRNALLYLSSQPQVFKFVRRNRMVKSFASRFVAGETLETALAAVKQLNSKGITATLDLLGESVGNEAEARESARHYLEMMDEIRKQKLDANASVKLTAMGLDISESLCVSNMQKILDKAHDYQTFVRLDMEGSDYTAKDTRSFLRAAVPVVSRQCRHRAAELSLSHDLRRRAGQQGRRTRAALQRRI